MSEKAPETREDVYYYVADHVGGLRYMTRTLDPEAHEVLEIWHRTDLVQSQIDAAVAAAYGDAASLCVILKSFPQLKEIGSTIHADLADDIRARTPTDAQAAQEQVRKEAREEALREAYNSLFVVPAASIEQEHMVQRCQASILALIPDTGEGDT